MLKITILMVGRTREAFIREGLQFYSQRLKPFLNLTLKSVQAEKETSGRTPELIKAREAERLQAQVPPRALVAALSPQGREFTSEEFAAWLTRLDVAARPLAFLLGGHWGLGYNLIAQAHMRLSLSRLTLTHELAPLALLEQLHRAMTIKTGHPYHV